MEIVHFAPFAPNAAGIYEAARDMARADILRGHQVSFVDTGATTVAGQMTPPREQATDDRGGWMLVTMPPLWANTADLLIYHTGVNDNWVVKNQAPIIMIIHGRPAASFRPEQTDPNWNAWTLTAELAKWPRIKKMVHFWPEFAPYWRTVIPDDKQVALEWPCVDLQRFSPDGPRHVFQPEHRGRVNALICDSWRQDVDIFEITIGAIEAARRIPGLKIHFYGVETVAGSNAVPHCWEYLIAELLRLGAMGELSSRQPNIDTVYRAVDFVMTPHRIVTRIIGEALACGVPVLAANGCKATPWVADIQEPEQVGRVAAELAKALVRNPGKVKADCLEMAQRFSCEAFGAAIEPIYREVVGR